MPGSIWPTVHAPSAVHLHTGYLSTVDPYSAVYLSTVHAYSTVDLSTVDLTTVDLTSTPHAEKGCLLARTLGGGSRLWPPPSLSQCPLGHSVDQEKYPKQIPIAPL